MVLNRIFLLFTFIVCFCAFGCNVINPAEKVPTYIRIDSFQFDKTDPAVTGSSSHKITSAWVYFNNQIAGVYELPANIPLITDAPGTVQIIPGITYSGMKNYQAQYPFYTGDSVSIAHTPGKVITVTPKTHYLSGIKFQWKEEFEVGNTFIKTNNDDSTDTSLIRVNDPSKVFEGGGSGYIYLNKAKPNSESINNLGFPITKGDCYMEINYKCTVPFQVGIETTAASGGIVFEYQVIINPSENWNKVYIGLQTFIGQYNGNPYRIMIKANLPEGQDNGYVLMDNLKVISY